MTKKTMNKTGILLINLGTPDTAQPEDIKTYLREFLNDPRVVDLSAINRWLLVNLIIIPFRYKKTARAYQKIWQGDSPLRIHSESLKNELAKVLGNDYVVEYGFRYGNPSIAAALKKLSHCSAIKILPLFPQYSSAATGSAIQKLMEIISNDWNIPGLEIFSDFYDQPYFIDANVEQIRSHLSNVEFDHLLFSYHGLPERHIMKSDCQATCDKIQTCPDVSERNRYCYRAQCYATTNAIMTKLATVMRAEASNASVAFQSRLGRTPWIKPYTDLVLPELRARGIKKLAVACPSFVADCLETLEEVDIRTREQWLELGGESFIFIPCINDSKIWVNGLKELFS